MMAFGTHTSIAKIARAVAHALVRVSEREEAARLSLPLMYPGGSMVGVEISRLRDGFLVTDAGGARREAGLLGGERAFIRIAREIAERFCIRFDQNMFFEMDVAENELISAVVAIANAAKTAVENTAVHLASIEHADYQAYLWDKLEKVYGAKTITKKHKIKGSSDLWEFDAAVQLKEHLAVFELVVPNANAVNSAVTKFLDVRDLGESAPRRIAVLTNIKTTPHLPVLGRTARIIPYDASDAEFREAA